MLPLIIVFTIAVFVLALISPRYSRKVERKTVHHTGTLKTKSKSLWTPLTFVAHGALNALRFLTTRSSRFGRRVHQKTKSDKK